MNTVFHSKKIKSASGFTMIELMIVVAIIGILAAIAYPNYSDSVVKSKRKAAATCLIEHAQFLERYYTTNLNYTGAVLPALGCANDLNTSYTFALNGATTATTYSVRATAIGGQATRDTLCGNLGLDQTGTKTESGTGTAQQCWLK